MGGARGPLRERVAKTAADEEGRANRHLARRCKLIPRLRPSMASRQTAERSLAERIGRGLWAIGSHQTNAHLIRTCLNDWSTHRPAYVT